MTVHDSSEWDSTSRLRMTNNVTSFSLNPSITRKSDHGEKYIKTTAFVRSFARSFVRSSRRPGPRIATPRATSRTMFATTTTMTTTVVVPSTRVPARSARGRGRCVARRVQLLVSSTRETTTTATIATDARATVTAVATAAIVLAPRAAMAEEISPFAGVVDISVLLLLAFLAKLGNEKAARDSASKTRAGSSGKRGGRR